MAIVLRVYFAEDSPLFFRSYRDPARWVFVSFLGLTAVHGLVTVLAIVSPSRTSAFQGLGALLGTLWLFLVFFLHRRSGPEGFARAGLALGDRATGVRLAAGVVAFFLVQAGLNLLLRLGDFRGVPERLYGVPVPAPLYAVAVLTLFLLAVTGMPLSGLALTFGEEYGWRGFLQDELKPLGRRRAALCIGATWGVWHFPLVLGGVYSYPPSALGLGLVIVLMVLVGFVFSFAVLKTGSIWVAAFLHALMNSQHAFIVTHVVRPESRVLSFGLGVYGLAMLAAIVLWLLQDPVWDKETSHRERSPEGG